MAHQSIPLDTEEWTDVLFKRFYLILFVLLELKERLKAREIG